MSVLFANTAAAILECLPLRRLDRPARFATRSEEDRLLLAATQLTAFSSAGHQEEKSRSTSSGLLSEV